MHLRDSPAQPESETWPPQVDHRRRHPRTAQPTTQPLPRWVPKTASIRALKPGRLDAGYHTRHYTRRSQWNPADSAENPGIDSAGGAARNRTSLILEPGRHPRPSFPAGGNGGLGISAATRRARTPTAKNGGFPRTPGIPQTRGRRILTHHSQAKRSDRALEGAKSRLWAPRGCPCGQELTPTPQNRDLREGNRHWLPGQGQPTAGRPRRLHLHGRERRGTGVRWRAGKRSPALANPLRP